MWKVHRLALVVLLAVGLTASCKEEKEELTWAEALEALEEAGLSEQASALTSGTIEIATDFTIGEAVEAAAEEIHNFIVSQMPCAEVTLSGATLTVEYGVHDGNCTYKGQTYSGTHTITVASTEEGGIRVDHEWADLQNQTVSVTGWSQVTWDFAGGSRQVEHELTWTRLRDDRQGTGSGDRTQSVLEGGLIEGIEVNGSRSWEGKSGTWDLAINDVQMRWVDPVPQAGTYSLGTPFNKTLTLTFSRLDEDTIEVAITNGNNEHKINVTATGG